MPTNPIIFTNLVYVTSSPLFYNHSEYFVVDVKNVETEKYCMRGLSNSYKIQKTITFFPQKKKSMYIKAVVSSLTLCVFIPWR